MRYLVVVEEGPTSFGAYVPDLPGCAAAAETREEALAVIREAIEFHVEGLKQDGQQTETTTTMVLHIGVLGSRQPNGPSAFLCSGRRRSLVAPKARDQTRCPAPHFRSKTSALAPSNGCVYRVQALRVAEADGVDRLAIADKRLGSASGNDGTTTIRLYTIE
jgi:predicted RNase H-like HicB family nuclease